MASISRVLTQKLSPTPSRRDRIKKIIRNVALAALAFVIVVAVVLWLLEYYVWDFPPNPNPPVTNSCRIMQAPSVGENGIGITYLSNIQEYVGISDGSFAFDTVRPDGDLKCQGVLDYTQKNYSLAEIDWSKAVLPENEVRFQEESDDAEALIYREDSFVQNSGYPYITVIVGTILTGPDVGIGRDDLQGAYVAQLEFNRTNPYLRLRLLIANFGSGAFESDNGQQIEDVVSRQINNAVLNSQQLKASNNQDTLNKGIMGIQLGLPFASNNTIELLDQSNIPVILSGEFSQGQLLNTNNIFPVTPSIELEGRYGADYVANTLKPERVALFEDRTNPYSYALANAFQNQLTKETFGNIQIIPEIYSIRDQQTIKSDVASAINNHVGLIYFAGDAVDADTIINELEHISPDTNLQVMGGDKLYELGGYKGHHYRHLIFTSFAFPDEWSWQNLPSPAFLDQYRLLYSGWPLDHPYGYSRPDSDVILSFDGLSVFLHGSEMAFTQKGVGFQPGDLEHELSSIQGKQSYLGFSGLISFGPDSQNRALLVLYVDNRGFTQLATIKGKFM